MVGAVECGESFEVVRSPGVFTLKELVDFALGIGTLGYCCGVVFADPLEEGAGGLDELLCAASVLATQRTWEIVDLVARCLSSMPQYRSSQSGHSTSVQL